MAKLDSLIIDLQVNTAALKSGLDTAKSALGSFSKQVDAIKDSMQGMVAIKVAGFAKDMAEAVVHLTEQMAEFVLNGSEATDHIRQLAEASGEGVKAFSELAFASTSVGLGTDDLAKGLEKLDKNLGAAGAGVRQQAGLFNALGVAVTDSSGSVRSTDTVFKDLADRFANMEDGASKTALAIKVFGRAGAEMIPFLNQGARGIEQLEAQARQLGITLNEQDSDAAHAFQSALKQVDGVVGGVAAKVATELTPALTRLAEDFLRSSEAAGLIKDTISAISTVFKVIISEAANAGAQILVVGRTIGAVAAALSSWNTGGPAEVFAQLEKDNKATYDALGRLLEDINGATQDFNQNLQPKAGEGPGGLNADKILKDASSVNVADEAMKKLTKTLDEYNQKIAALSGGGAKDPIAEMAERLKSGDLSKELAKAGAAAAGMQDKLMAAAKTLQALTLSKIKIDFDITETARAATAMAGAEAKSTRSDAKTDAEAKQSTTDFNNIGVSPQALFKQLTAGFTSFGDALQSWTDNTKAASEQELNVALNEASAAAQRSLAADELKAGNLAGAAAAEEAAANFTKAAQKAQLMADADTTAATASKKAADAFSKAATDFHATFENLSGGLNVLFQGLVSKMGKLGEVIQAGVQGFAQGGIWGALAAVIAEFITQVKGWSAVMTLGNGQFQAALNDMGKSIGNLLDGFKDLMGGIESIAQVVHQILNPIFTLLGVVLKGITPIFVLIGTVLQPLVPIISMIAELLGSTLGPILNLLSYTLIPVVETVLAFEFALDGLWWALEDMVNGIDDLVRSFTHDASTNNTGGLAQARAAMDNTVAQMATLAGFTKDSNGKWDASVTADDIFNSNPLGREAASNNATDNMLENGDTGAGDNSLGSVASKAAGGLNDMIAAAQANAAASDGVTTSSTAAAKALNKMSAELADVPEGFKVDLRRFQAQSATNGTHGTGIGAVHNYNIGSVNLQAGNLDQLSDQLKKLAAKKRFHTTGAPGMP